MEILLYIYNVLKTVHKKFLELFLRMSISGSGPWTRSDWGFFADPRGDAHDICKDFKLVMSKIQRWWFWGIGL